MSQDIRPSDKTCSLFAHREPYMNRLSKWLALASTLSSSLAVAQSRDVETIADPGPDARHPTATATRVVVEPTDDLAEKIEAVPGVHSRRTSYGQTAYATVRGSNTRQVLVEYEGLRLNPPFGPGFDLGGGFGLGVDAVTVWRGAAATYRGSGALAGALELHTRHLRRRGSRLDATILRGSHDTLAGQVSAAVATPEVSTRLGIGGRMSEGDFAFIDEQGVSSIRINNDHRRGAAFGATELRLGDGWVRTAVLHDEGERGTPGVSEFQTQFREARLSDAQTAVVLVLAGNNLVNAGSWSTDGALRAAVQRRSLEYSNPEPFLGSAPIFEQTRSDTVTTVAEITAWGPTSVGRAAADVHFDNWRSTVDADRVTSGLGASWEQALGEQWTAVAAMRGEVDSDGRTAALPAFGANFQPHDDWTLRSNIARSFRAPNLDELYLELESVRGNPDLVSEAAWAGDIGASFDRDRFDAEVTAFGRIVDDEILFLPVSAYLVEAQNIGGTYAVGAEVEASLDLRRFRARAAYTFTRARFRETDVGVPLQPEHAVHTRVALIPFRWLDIWTGGNLRGPVTLDVFGNTTDEAHLFWDAGCSFGTDAARLHLTARNLLDDERAVDSTQQPIPGRTLWASIDLRWEDTP